MWWTQPRLTVMACLLYFVAYISVVNVVAGPGGQSTAIAALGVVILLVYRAVSLELAERHASGRMRDAFDGAVWRTQWTQQDFVDLRDLASALESGADLPDDPSAGERFHEPLARATGKFEAARLRTHANWIAFAAGMAIGWIALYVPWSDDSNRLVTGGLLVPLVVSSHLGMLVDRAAAQALLRARSVGRVAALVPRSFGDLGLEKLGHPLRLAMVLGFGFFMMAASWYVWPDVARSIVGASIAAYVFLMLATERFALQRLPLLRFAGPPEVSAFIDHQVRVARIRLVSGPGMLFVVAVAGAWEQMDLLAGFAAGLFTATHIVFAWRPDIVGRRRSSLELAAHLQDLQRRWGLSVEAADRGPRPSTGPRAAPR